MSAMENRQYVKVFIGVDPGKSGSMAVLYTAGDWYQVDDVRQDNGWMHRDRDEIVLLPFGEAEFLAELRNVERLAKSGIVVKAVVEHVGGMPGQSAPASFNFGDNFGFTRGLLTALGIPYELVRPQKWKKEFSCTSDKNTAIDVAKRLFPGVNLKRTPRCTKDDDGHAEALLIAEFCRRRLA